MTQKHQKPDSLGSKQNAPFKGTSAGCSLQAQVPPLQETQLVDQTNLLTNTKLPVAQRQALVRQIGNTNGNKHVTQLVSALPKHKLLIQRTPPDNHTEENSASENAQSSLSELEEQIIPIPESAKSPLQNNSGSLNQPAAAEDPCIPEKARVHAPPKFQFELLPPELQLRFLDDFNFTATVTAARLAWQQEQLRLSLGYEYGNAITTGADYQLGAATLSGQIGIDPSEGQVQAGLGYKRGLWSTAVNGDMAGAFDATLSYGQQYPPMAPKFGDSMVAGEKGFRNTLRDVPNVLDDPAELPDFLTRHSQAPENENGKPEKSNFDKMGTAAENLGRVVDLRNQTPSRINWGFFLRFTRSQEGDVAAMGGLGVSMKRDEHAHPLSFPANAIHNSATQTTLVQRGKKGEGEATAGIAPNVGIASGESETPSDKEK